MLCRALTARRRSSRTTRSPPPSPPRTEPWCRRDPRAQHTAPAHEGHGSRLTAGASTSTRRPWFQAHSWCQFQHQHQRACAASRRACTVPHSTHSTHSTHPERAGRVLQWGAGQFRAKREVVFVVFKRRIDGRRRGNAYSPADSPPSVVRATCRCLTADSHPSVACHVSLSCRCLAAVCQAAYRKLSCASNQIPTGAAWDCRPQHAVLVLFRFAASGVVLACLTSNRIT